MAINTYILATECIGVGFNPVTIATLGLFGFTAQIIVRGGYDAGGGGSGGSKINDKELSQYFGDDTSAITIRVGYNNHIVEKSYELKENSIANKIVANVVKFKEIPTVKAEKIELDSVKINVVRVIENKVKISVKNLKNYVGGISLRARIK